MQNRSAGCHVHLQVYTNLSDGSYNFTVRILNTPPGQAAALLFTIDTSGPAVMLLSVPDAVVATSLVQFAFVATGDVAFECQLVRSGQATSVFEPCSSPL